MTRLLDQLERFFEKLAHFVTRWAGSTLATVLAFATILIWVIGGAVWFGFGSDYQMYVNTGTTIITFLMVFLIQRAQNKDAQAIQLKLNELVAATQGASNRLINVEDFSEKEIAGLHGHYCKLVELAKQDAELTASHSVEEAQGRHERKKAASQALPARKATKRKASSRPGGSEAAPNGK